MKNLFKKFTAKKTPMVSVESVNQSKLIEEIHETFYTEVDRLLQSAKISHSLESDKQELLEKCERLKKLGFTNTKEVQEAESEIRRINDLKRENKQKAKLVEAIDYFTGKYTNYKFITVESVEKICEKYGFVYGDIATYIGTVPTKNLEHIENFKIDEDDLCIIKYDSFDGEALYQSKIDFEREKRVKYGSIPLLSLYDYKRMDIVAPLKDFNTEGMELDGFTLKKIQIPDPIVLQPVCYKDELYYLIVTAWGDEAADNLVINPAHN